MAQRAPCGAVKCFLVKTGEITFFSAGEEVFVTRFVIGAAVVKLAPSLLLTPLKGAASIGPPTSSYASLAQFGTGKNVLTR